VSDIEVHSARPRGRRDPGANDRRKVYLVLAAFGGAMVLFLAVGIAVALYLHSRTETSDATDRDFEVLVTAADISEYFEGLAVDPEREHATVTRSFDRSVEVEYEYDHPDPDRPLLVQSSISIERTERKAKQAWMALVVGSLAGFAIGSDGGVTKREDNEFFSAGDQSRHFFISGEEGNVGHMVFVRIGRRVMMLLLSGAHFEDPESFAELLSPKLEALPRYDPRPAEAE
jgi:hypothetical protein